MEKNQKIREELAGLSLKQQVGLWVVLRLDSVLSEKFSFYSSEFADKFKKFIKESVRSNQSVYGKLVGGVLSGLSRNRLLIKISSGRDARWTLEKKIKDDYELYKQLLFEIKIYWPEEV
jgi:hypothetical protein